MQPPPNQPRPAQPAGNHSVPFRIVIVLIAFVYGCAIYANLSFAVRNPADYRFFPPFKRHVNANDNISLGAENFNIARSLTEGQGFAHPFNAPSGPTAWMPPVLPAVLAGLLLVCHGDRETVMAVVVFVQMTVLIGTGLLVLTLAQRTNRRLGPGLTLGVFAAALLSHFFWWFQLTQDCWLVLLAVDLLLAGLCWGRPLESMKRAAAWGIFGGLSALISPIVGSTWGIVSVWLALRKHAWGRAGVAILAAALTVTPWLIRNYLVFGRWIPIKSNLAYELYQSQCLQPDGQLQSSTFRQHPYTLSTAEGREYTRLGEMAFMDRKREQFREAVLADPLDFVKRLGKRFLGATLWYVPDVRSRRVEHPCFVWLTRLTHPLPFLAFLVLAFAAFRAPPHREQWIVMCMYVLYLLPYVAVSYYDRYAAPLLPAKVLLVMWAAERLVPSSGEVGRITHLPRSRASASASAASALSLLSCCMSKR